jgi:beta-lactamase superfamily II metal-dependent hydrolase
MILKPSKQHYMLTFFICGALPLHGSLEVALMDVGQGNCTVITPTEQDVPVLLVDCGSTDYTFKRSNFLADQVNRIVDKISTNCLLRSAYEMVVVISHPDTDHYGALADVINGCKRKNSLFRVTQVFLGARLGSYKARFKSFLEELARGGTIITFPTESGAMIHSQFIFQKDTNKPSYSILPALQCTKDEESNSCSLVVRIEYDGKVCLLTGDATKKTTEYIHTCLRSTGNEAFIKADILQASHHGAGNESSEKCNDPLWIKLVEPTFVVFSSGLKHLHPREETVHSFLEVLPIPSEHTFHALFFGENPKKDEKKLTPFGRYRRKYGSILTAKGLYGTLADGTITFVLASGVPIGRPRTEGQEHYDSREESIKSCLSMKLPGVFILDNLKSLNFTGSNVHDDNNNNRTLLIAVLSSLNKLSVRQLKSLILTGNKTAHDDTFKELIGLLAHEGLSRLHVEGLSADQAKQLVKAWDARGLIIHTIDHL